MICYVAAWYLQTVIMAIMHGKPLVNSLVIPSHNQALLLVSCFHFKLVWPVQQC